MWTAASDQVITQTMNSFGSQSFASTKMEEVFFGATVWPRLDPTDRALVRSQRGPMASIPFHTPPVSAASRFDPQCLRVLLLRRLWCQLPLSFATCWCGQPLGSRGHHRGFWVAEGIRWRVVRLGSAGKQEQGCPSTSVPKTWTYFQGQEQTTVVWKWSLTVCLSFTAHSWPWTPRWSAPSELTELPGGSVQNGMEPPWTKPVAPKSEPTQNQRANTEGPDSWCLRARQEEDGPRSPTHSSDSRPERGPGRSAARCELQQEGRGSDDGALLWRVAQLRRSRSPCWSAEEVWGLMGRFRRPLTSSGKTVTGASSELSCHIF